MLKYIAISRMKEGAKVNKLLLVSVGGVGEGNYFAATLNTRSVHSKCKYWNELCGLH